ncbi:MAG: hypothetical protein ACR2PL_21855, partial [Dehalococcoidia bacterium]
MTARTSRPTTLLTLIALVAIFAFAPRGAPPLRAQQTNPTLRGSQPGVLGPVALHAGVVIVRARSNGADLFTVALINQDPA